MGVSGRLGASKRRMLSLAERLPLAVLARGAADGMLGDFPAGNPILVHKKQRAHNGIVVACYGRLTYQQLSPILNLDSGKASAWNLMAE